MVSRDDRAQGRSQGAEIDLVAELQCRSGSSVCGGVVPAPEEAPVDQFLDPAPRRPEQRGHGEGRGGDREARVLGDPAEGELEQEHAAEVGERERRRSARRRPACG